MIPPVTESFMVRSRGEPQSWEISRSIFLRGLGAIYAIAFLSFWTQLDGLIGENGILPAADFTKRVIAYASQNDLSAHRLAPTLSIFVEGDWFVHLQCFVGIILSLCLIAGLIPGLMSLLLWLLYLSITVLGQTFMGFQWENLLLEAGLIAVLLAPWKGRLKSGFESPPRERLPRLFWLVWERAPHTLGRFLCWWLLFRLMFQSGLVKLASNDDVWWDLSALGKHYWTQPIPNVVAWYAHQLPDWFDRISVALTYGIEIVVPFLILGPRTARRVACYAIMSLMALIALTGNYTFFNGLTALLCISLLDDASWPAFLRRSYEKRSRDHVINGWSTARLRSLALPAVLGLGAAGILAVYHASIGVFYLSRTTDRFLQAVDSRFQKEWQLPVVGQPEILSKLSPYRSINSYGLFANMTEHRPEIVIEGSSDGVEWSAYEFKYKPGRLDRRPPFVAPHQPRLDWQMWFAALGRWERNGWFVRLIGHLLEGTDSVEALLAYNPFGDTPPQFIRASLYDYTFTGFQQKRQTGDWWERNRKGFYFPEISLESYKSRIVPMLP